MISPGFDVSILRASVFSVTGDDVKMVLTAKCVERAPDAYSIRNLTGESEGQEYMKTTRKSEVK